MNKRVHLASAVLLSTAALSAQANLVNGDFSDGWTGWIGDDFSLSYDPPDSAGSNIFQLCNGQISAGGGGSGSGPCSTSGGPPGENYARIDAAPTVTGTAGLYQDFMVPKVATGLSFDYLWDPSDGVNEFFSATLQDVNTLEILDLLAGVPSLVGGPTTVLAEIPSDWWMRDVRLSVGITDLDFVSDVLDVDNFRFVPEPATVLLTAMGLAGIGGLRRRRRA
jgi:hypothetical protein